MPQFQVLQKSPGFGEDIGAALGVGLGGGLSRGISDALNQFNKSQENKRQLAGLAPLFKDLGFEEESVKQMLGSGLDPQLLANVGVALGQQKTARAKGEAKMKASEQDQRVGQESFDRMAELLKEGKLGLGSKTLGKAFGGKRAEDVGEFESLSGALEAMLVDRVSRGTLSNSRFKYITETLLPKPNDRDRTIKGKMKALARELDLDPSVLGGESGSSKQESGDFVFMKDPQGNVKRIPRNQAMSAQKAGGKLVQ